jgi:hypothetical protein
MKILFYFTCIVLSLILNTISAHADSEWSVQQVIGKYLNSDPPKSDQVFNFQYKVVNGTLQNLTTDKYGQFIMHVQGNDKGSLILKIPQNYPYSNIATDHPRAIIFVNGMDLLQKYSFEKSDCFFEYTIPFSGKSVITLGFLAYPEKLPYNGNIVPNYCLSQRMIPEYPSFAIPILIFGITLSLVFYRIKMKIV